MKKILEKGYKVGPSNEHGVSKVTLPIHNNKPLHGKLILFASDARDEEDKRNFVLQQTEVLPASPYWVRIQIYRADTDKLTVSNLRKYGADAILAAIQLFDEPDFKIEWDIPKEG